MRFVYYVDEFLNKKELIKFQEETVSRFANEGFLKGDDVLVVVPRPGYITEIVALTD